MGAVFILLAAWPGVLAQLSFTGIVPLANRENRIQLNVPVGTLATVDVSSNLVDWNGFLTTGGGSLTHTDLLGANDVLRFYRAARAEAGTMTGDRIPTDAGDLVIHPVYHAGLVMTWNGKTIYSDPNAGSFAGLPKGDLMLVTHSHGDHFNAGTLTAQMAAGAVIVAPQPVYNAMSATLRASTSVQANGSTATFFGIQVETIPAYNSYHTRGECNSYVLTLGGKRVFISGDTGDTPEMRALRNIDVAFVAVNVPYTMNVSQAISVIRGFAPMIVYPYHLLNQDGSYSNVGALKTGVGTDLGIEVRLRRWY